MPLTDEERQRVKQIKILCEHDDITTSCVGWLIVLILRLDRELNKHSKGENPTNDSHFI